jgi:tetratricopeptide (TPR) repeat protein
MSMDDRDSYLQRIAELIERNGYRQALAVCDQALAAHPDCAEAHDYRGLILCRMGRHREALPSYDRAIHLEPDFVAALLDKAELLVYYLGENEAGIGLCDRVLRLGSHELDMAHAQYLKGISYANLGQHDEALLDHDASLRLDPDYPDAHCERGVSLYETYRFGDAVKALKSAVGLDPAYARPHHYLGCIYEYMGEDDLAQREFASASSLDADAYPSPLRLDEDDFQRAVSEAVHTLPRQVARLMPQVDLRVRVRPDRRLLADGRLPPSALCFRGAPERGGATPLILYQRNLEHAVRSRAELVEEIAHAIAHELGHPEQAA